MCAAADRRRSAHALPIRPDSPSGPSRHTRIDMHMLCRSQCAYRHATEAHAPANTTSARAAWHTLAQLHQPCRCVARFEFIAAVAKPSRRGAPSSTAAAPKGSMFSFIICSCHRPRRGAPGCSWSSAVASVQVLDALQRSTFAGTPAADAGHPGGHQKRAHF